MRGSGFADDRELLAVPPGHDQQIGAGLFLVVGGNRHQRRPIADLDDGLELRQIGDQPRRAGDVVELRDALFFDERGRLGKVALQLRFGLAGHAAADEIHRGANREHRQQRAGQEDAIGDRAQHPH